MVDKKKLGGRYEFNFNISSDTVALIYFAERYKFDLVSLLLLYEKYGRDVFYFFFILSGMKITFPKANKFLKIMEFCRSVTKEITEGKKAVINNVEYKQVYDSVMDKLTEDENGKRFQYSLRVMNNDIGRIDIEANAECGIPDSEFESDGADDELCDDDIGVSESLYDED